MSNLALERLEELKDKLKKSPTEMSGAELQELATALQASIRANKIERSTVGQTTARKTRAAKTGKIAAMNFEDFEKQLLDLQRIKDLQAGTTTPPTTTT